jgi:hypothetical protein
MTASAARGAAGARRLVEQQVAPRNWGARRGWQHVNAYNGEAATFIYLGRRLIFVTRACVGDGVTEPWLRLALDSLPSVCMVLLGSRDAYLVRLAQVRARSCASAAADSGGQFGHISYGSGVRGNRTGRLLLPSFPRMCAKVGMRNADAATPQGALWEQQ